MRFVAVRFVADVHNGLLFSCLALCIEDILREVIGHVTDDVTRREDLTPSVPNGRVPVYLSIRKK